MRPINPATDKERQKPHLVVAYGDGVVSVHAREGNETVGRITLTDEEMEAVVKYWNATPDPDEVRSDRPLMVADTVARMEADAKAQPAEAGKVKKEKQK